MKVSFISHLYPNQEFPAKGTFIREQFLALKNKIDAGMVVPSVYALPFTEKWRYTHRPFLVVNEALRIRYLSFPNGGFPRIIRKSLSAALTSCLHKCNPELVHMNWLLPDGLAIPAIKKMNLPVVLSIHGSDWYTSQSRPLLKRLVYESLTQSDVILTVGKKLKRDILHSYPELDKKIRVSFNPVDFNKFHPPLSRNEAMALLEWDPDKKHLLCVANITPEKGVDTLLRAFKKLKTKNTVLHIIGNIPDIPYSRKVTAEIKKEHHVILHTPIAHDDIVQYYQASDLVVLPSRREGFGLSLAEGIACGKPVVSTKSGGPEDIVKNENGFLVEPDDSGDMALKMDYLLSSDFRPDPDKIRESILESFHTEKIMGHLVSLYGDLLHS